MKKIITLIILLSTFSIFGQDIWTVYNSSNSDLTFDNINNIEFDSQGNKWISSNGAGIAKFDDTNWTFFNTENQQGTSDIYRIEFTTGTLEGWVSVYSTTIVNLADGTQVTINSEHDYDNNILTIEIPVNATSFEIDYYIENSSSIVEMKFYNVATTNIIHQETLTGQMNYEFDYTFYSNITSNHITDISIDNVDNKWFGTSDNGLIKFDDNNWINFTSSNSGLPNDNINCITIDNDNNIWIGSSSGLTKFDGVNWTTYDTSNSNIPDNNVKTIAIDNNNDKWLIINEWSNAKLVQFTNTNWSVYENTSTGWFRGDLVIDENNKKWLSAEFGIISFDNGNWEYFNYLGANSSCLIDCQTEAIAMDLSNNIWVGTFQECNNGGLLNFTQCDDYLTSNSDLPGNNVMVINIDNNGDKWIGTYYNGIAKLETNTLSINENEVSSIKVYPNPVSDFILIETNNIGLEYIIINSLGQNIKNGILSDFLTSISFKEFEKGIYYIKITQNKEIKTYKIIK